MSRPLRIEYENAVYHITARGNEKGYIFLGQKDFDRFLGYLGRMQERYKIITYAYCLMRNHYHLLLETPKPNLSRVMRDLNGHYTIYFNKRHKRCGHLFQGRYKAILVDKDNYLLELSRYIHLNPVRAGIISKPEDYTYSSMAEYLGKRVIPKWLRASFILRQFGNTIKEQQIAYGKFVQSDTAGLKNSLKNIYAGAILGSENFLNTIRDKFLKKADISEQVPESKKLRYAKDLNDIAGLVMEYYDINKETLARKKAKLNNGKKAFVYLVRKYTSSTLKQIRSFLDNHIAEGGISKIYTRMQEELKSQLCLREDLDKLEKRLLGDPDMYHVKT